MQSKNCLKKNCRFWTENPGQSNPNDTNTVSQPNPVRYDAVREATGFVYADTLRVFQHICWELVWFKKVGDHSLLGRRFSVQIKALSTILSAPLGVSISAEHIIKALYE